MDLARFNFLYFLVYSSQLSYFVFQEHFEEALKELNEVVSTGQTDLAALQTTVTYNLARSLEMLCMFDEAERLYKGILQEKPNYIDCKLLRLLSSSLENYYF